VESTQLTTTQLPPPREKYYEPDQVAKRVFQDAEYQLLRRNGSSEKISHTSKYDHYRTDGTILPKVVCLGAFPSGYEAFVVSAKLSERKVSYMQKRRVNQRKLWRLYPEHRLGRTLKVVLVNGWELVGLIEGAGQFYLALRLSETVVVYLYRHALADFEWVGEEPPSLTPEQAAQTKQQLLDLSYTPPHLKPKVKKVQNEDSPALSSAKPTKPPLGSMKALSEAIKEEVARTMVNAKLKLVLREIPPTLQELEDIVWIPLQNQSKGLPKGLELGPLPVDLVVSKKMWAGAMKKAQELKQTGQKVLYVFEAMVGSFQNRVAAVASSVQVAEDKPKVK
jgi:sRNA-binding regulator protein Hfq